MVLLHILHSKTPLPTISLWYTRAPLSGKCMSAGRVPRGRSRSPCARGGQYVDGVGTYLSGDGFVCAVLHSPLYSGGGAALVSPLAVLSRPIATVSQRNLVLLGGRHAADICHVIAALRHTHPPQR